MWFCSYCKADFEEPAREPPDEYHDPRTVRLLCPYCGEDAIEELPNCIKCRQPIHPGERSYDGMCPDCFRADVLDLLDTSPQLLAKYLEVHVEEVT